MKRFSLRLPDELHQSLEQLAQMEHRSLHSQILIMLEDCLGSHQLRVSEMLPGGPVPEGSVGEAEEVETLMIMDGDRNQPVDLLQLKPQTFAVFGRRNRHFLRVLSWDPASETSRREFSALARAGYHIRRWG